MQRSLENSWTIDSKIFRVIPQSKFINLANEPIAHIQPKFYLKI